MGLILKPLYERGQLVRISLEESRRLGVPKDRPWLIVQNSKVKDSKYIVICHLTGQRREDGSLKPLLSTDVPISKKDEPSLDKDSYIRCSQLHSVEVDSVEYVGTIAPIFMLLVDKSLALCLGLEEQMGITVSPDRPAIALSPKREKFTGRDLAPIKSLPTRKRGKKVKRRRP